jgi:hypothetical protein
MPLLSLDVAALRRRFAIPSSKYEENESIAGYAEHHHWVRNGARW